MSGVAVEDIQSWFAVKVVPVSQLNVLVGLERIAISTFVSYLITSGTTSLRLNAATRRVDKVRRAQASRLDAIKRLINGPTRFCRRMQENNYSKGEEYELNHPTDELPDHEPKQITDFSCSHPHHLQDISALLPSGIWPEVASRPLLPTRHQSSMPRTTTAGRLDPSCSWSARVSSSLLVSCRPAGAVLSLSSSSTRQ